MTRSFYYLEGKMPMLSFHSIVKDYLVSFGGQFREHRLCSIVYSPLPLNNSQDHPQSLQLISTFHQRKKKNHAIRFSKFKDVLFIGQDICICFLNWLLCFVDGEACHEVFSQESVRLPETLTIHIGSTDFMEFEGSLKPIITCAQPCL